MAKPRTFETTVAPVLPETPTAQVISDPRFASLDDLTHKEIIDAKTRPFVSTGGPFLVVPDLEELEAIRIGNMFLPLTESRDYPHDGQLHCNTVEEPLVAVQNRSDGTPVLIRAKISNDGLWPTGTTIYVTGRWKDEAVSESEEPKTD